MKKRFLSQDPPLFVMKSQERMSTIFKVIREMPYTEVFL